MPRHPSSAPQHDQGAGKSKAPPPVLLLYPAPPKNTINPGLRLQVLQEIEQTGGAVTREPQPIRAPTDPGKGWGACGGPILARHKRCCRTEGRAQTQQNPIMPKPQMGKNKFPGPIYPGDDAKDPFELRRANNSLLKGRSGFVLPALGFPPAGCHPYFFLITSLFSPLPLDGAARSARS